MPDKDTSCTKSLQVVDNLIILLVRLYAEAEDDGVWVVGEAGDVGHGEPRAYVDIEDVIPLIDEGTHRVGAYTAWLVLHTHTYKAPTCSYLQDWALQWRK